MNVFLGEVLRSENRVSNKFSKFIKSTYNEKTLDYSAKNLYLGASKTEKSIISVAQKKNVTLVYYGYVLGPIPGWSKPYSTVDNHKETADFLLDSYISKGKNFLRNLVGHFSLVIHDSNKQTTYLLRDPSGQNDLFIYHTESRVLFSNKVYAIAHALGEDLEIERSYENFFLIYGFYPFGKTPYKNIHCVPQSRLIEINKNLSYKESPIKYNSSNPVPHLNSQEELINKLKDTLLDITKRMIPTNEKRVAVLLGGFDSALVASLLKKQGCDVETFSFYYSDELYNQAHTDTLAEYLDIKHNWIKVDEKTIKNGLENFAPYFNQPTNWPSYVIQTAYLAEEIQKRGFKYCYTGDGCDYLFYGYPITYKRAQVMNIIGSLPNSILSSAIKILERPSFERKIGRPYQVGLGLLRSARRNKNIRTFLTFRIFDELSLRQVRNYKSPPKQRDTEKIVSQLAKAFRGVSPVKLAYEGKKQVSPNRNKLNGSADISGLIIASPYMHPDLKSFMKSVPDELLRPKGSQMANGKYILSKMAETKKLLPKEIIYQPKIGAADSPIESWYRGPLKKTIFEILENLPFEYRKKYIDSLINETRAERSYSKLISKDTKSLVTISHCVSLLLTYASFTKLKRKY